eukprot:3120033-Pyramimonas_sp.AAC.1
MFHHAQDEARHTVQDQIRSIEQHYAHDAEERTEKGFEVAAVKDALDEVAQQQQAQERPPGARRSRPGQHERPTRRLGTLASTSSPGDALEADRDQRILRAPSLVAILQGPLARHLGHDSAQPLQGLKRLSISPQDF